MEHTSEKELKKKRIRSCGEKILDVLQSPQVIYTSPRLLEFRSDFSGGVFVCTYQTDLGCETL